MDQKAFVYSFVDGYVAMANCVKVESPTRSVTGKIHNYILFQNVGDLLLELLKPDQYSIYGRSKGRLFSFLFIRSDKSIGFCAERAID